MSRKYHRTTYTLVVLSEDAIPPRMDIADVIREAGDGDYSMGITSTTREALDAPTMAAALLAQGSDPLFFGISGKVGA